MAADHPEHVVSADPADFYREVASRLLGPAWDDVAPTKRAKVVAEMAQGAEFRRTVDAVRIVTLRWAADHLATENARIHQLSGGYLYGTADWRVRGMAREIQDATSPPSALGVDFLCP